MKAIIAYKPYGIPSGYVEVSTRPFAPKKVVKKLSN